MISLTKIVQNIVEFFTQWGSLNYCSIEFLIVFIVFYYIFIALRVKRNNLMLLYVMAFGLFFAYKANGWLMLLLPFTTFCSWWLTERIRTCNNSRNKKLLATFSVCWVLVPLLYFKYANFSIQSLNDMIQTNFELLDIILPIGISFYTFQAISYIVDVYKGKFREQVSLLEYSFFLTFFPLLMAGPITRAETLIPQIKERGSQDPYVIYSGLWLIILGVLKKGLIADYLAQYNNWIFEDPSGFSGFENFMGVLGYGMQIYLDFSGYSDMSIGIAALLGFRLLPNFNSPYRSLNMSDFWRRWHIALSTWFRDYIYIPLGGNRKGKLRTYVNNFITMLFAGFWHGASGMFILWGGYHGVGLIIHKLCKPWLDKIKNSWYVNVASWMLTMVFVFTGYIFFRSPDLSTAGLIIQKICKDFDFAYFIPFCNARPLWTAFVFMSLAIHVAVSEKTYYKIHDCFVKSHWIVKFAVFLIAVQLIISIGSENVQPFIYAQF